MSLHNPHNVLVTGGAGFIGANFVEYLLETDSAANVITLDSLTYAGSLDNLALVMSNLRHQFVKGDITDASLVNRLINEKAVDTIVHFAAESHVDRSITGPAAFITTNVVGTFTLLEAARTAWLGNGQRGDVRFHHVSTDEVFGSLSESDPPFSETTPYSPNSPYSASKAGVHGLTLWLATYWARSGIRVNTVCPGGVYNGHDPEFVRRYADRTPMGRMADPEDLVGTMVYLASDASRYCTGQRFLVDGGLSAW